MVLLLGVVPALAQSGAVHIVRSGETVFGIVTRTYGCPASAVEQVARDNRLVNYRIFPNQALLINCASAARVTSPDGLTTITTPFSGMDGDFGIVLPVTVPQGSTVTIIVRPVNPAPPRPVVGALNPTPTPAPAPQGLSLVDMQALLALRGFSPTSPVWCDSPSVLSDPTRPQLTPQFFDAIPTQICPPGLVAIVAKSRDAYTFIFGQPPPER
jgi:hypothetical protein